MISRRGIPFEFELEFRMTVNWRDSIPLHEARFVEARIRLGNGGNFMSKNEADVSIRPVR